MRRRRPRRTHRTRQPRRRRRTLRGPDRTHDRPLATTASHSQQAASRPGAISSSGGASRRHRSVANVQRGANAQPTISSRSDGTTPGDLVQPHARPLDGGELRDRAHEPEGVGMERLIEEVVRARLLHLAPRVHDHHPLRGLRHHPEVVGDEDDGRPDLLLELEHEIQDLGLNRDVEGGGGFIGDEDRRIAGEGHRDHHPLAHPSGHLVGILLGPAPRLRDLHEVEHRGRLRLRRPLREAPMQLERFGDLAPDRHHRIERGHRLLEDHRDPVAPNLAHPLLAHLEQVLAVEPDRARCDLRGRYGQQPEDGHRGDLLPHPDSPTIDRVSPGST